MDFNLKFSLWKSEQGKAYYLQWCYLLVYEDFFSLHKKLNENWGMIDVSYSMC